MQKIARHGIYLFLFYWRKKLKTNFNKKAQFLIDFYKMKKIEVFIEF